MMTFENILYVTETTKGRRKKMSFIRSAWTNGFKTAVYYAFHNIFFACRTCLASALIQTAWAGQYIWHVWHTFHMSYMSYVLHVIHFTFLTCHMSYTSYISYVIHVIRMKGTLVYATQMTFSTCGTCMDSTQVCGDDSLRFKILWN